MAAEGRGEFIKTSRQVEEAYLQDRTKSVEEPPMGVDLFLILFFEAEDDLYWYDPPFCACYLEVRRDTDCKTLVR